MKDILECRIELCLLEVGNITLCALPDDDPVTVDEFTAATDKNCLQAAESLTRYFAIVQVIEIGNFYSLNNFPKSSDKEFQSNIVK